MRHRNRPSERSQVESLLRQFAQAPGLPFADVLDNRLVHHILNHGGVSGRGDAIYTPAVTLALFVGQAIDPDPSLRQAVARLLAERQAQGLSACSGETGAYAMARQRLPENVLAVLARSVGANLLCDACSSWSWRGRDVKIIDGSTLSIPDTPANQAVYPQSPSQQPGVGFPLMRVVALFSLAVGTVLAAAYGPYQGKETGETALLRSLHHHLDERDVLLADRYFCSYFEIALLGQRGVDAVFRLHQCRHADFRAGQCLASGDRLVTWFKPQRPVWLDEATYRQLPDQLTLRMLRIHVPKHIRNVRSRCIDLVTTLLDPQAFPKKALAELFWLRWHAELDLRSLKCVLQMDVLRGKSPEMVQKELWAHLLAYNLIRKVMAQAAATHNVPPRQLSFKGAVQTLLAFAPTLLRCSHSKFVEHTVTLFAAIVSHRVGHRPGRLEPRRKKRRPKPYPLLRIPRRDARRLELV
jgi:hypothetical protein